MKVWLDDIRPAPDGWVHVLTPDAAIELLRTGQVEAISLDHDLGLESDDNERTGYDVLRWLEESVGSGEWRHAIPAMYIHSANSIGRRRMQQAIESIRRLSGE